MRRAAVAATTALLLTCAPTAASASFGAQAPQPPRVRVLDAGDTPRKPLRLRLTAGSTASTELQTEIKLTQNAGGRSRTIASPPIVITITTRVTEVTPDGDATISFTYDEARAKQPGTFPRDQLEQAQEQLDAIEGISGTLSITPTGIATSGTFDIPSDVNATTRQLLEQFEDQITQISVPLPEEAIGKGARWEATQDLELAGATLRQTARYTLKKRTNDRITLEVSVKQRADDQTIDSAQGSVDLIRSRGSGKGASVIDLARPIPRSAVLLVEVKQRLRSGGQTINQTVKTEVELRPSD